MEPTSVNMATSNHSFQSDPAPSPIKRAPAGTQGMRTAFVVALEIDASKAASASPRGKVSTSCSTGCPRRRGGPSTARSPPASIRKRCAGAARGARGRSPAGDGPRIGGDHSNQAARPDRLRSRGKGPWGTRRLDQDVHRLGNLPRQWLRLTHHNGRHAEVPRLAQPHLCVGADAGDRHLRPAGPGDEGAQQPDDAAAGNYHCITCRGFAPLPHAAAGHRQRLDQGPLQMAEPVAQRHGESGVDEAVFRHGARHAQPHDGPVRALLGVAGTTRAAAAAPLDRQGAHPLPALPLLHPGPGGVHHSENSWPRISGRGTQSKFGLARAAETSEPQMPTARTASGAVRVPVPAGASRPGRDPWPCGTASTAPSRFGPERNQSGSAGRGRGCCRNRLSAGCGNRRSRGRSVR